MMKSFLCYLLLAFGKNSKLFIDAKIAETHEIRWESHSDFVSACVVTFCIVMIIFWMFENQSWLQIFPVKYLQRIDVFFKIWMFSSDLKFFDVQKTQMINANFKTSITKKKLTLNVPYYVSTSVLNVWTITF